MNIWYYHTTIGKIGIAEARGSITNLYFEQDAVPQDLVEEESPLLAEAAKQLEGYLVGQVKKFTVPLAASGTPFMSQVWAELDNIPYGQTATYKEIATKIGNDKAARAVGLANNRNPIPIFIPCHRVVGANGTLTGYRGGLAMKKVLLELEKEFQ